MRYYNDICVQEWKNMENIIQCRCPGQDSNPVPSDQKAMWTETIKQKHSEKAFQCYTVHHKSHMTWDPTLATPEWNLQLFYFLFIYLVCETIGTVATPGLLCQPRVIVKMIVEKLMECRLAGETEVLGENLPHHKIPHDQTRAWTRAAAVGSRWLTAWAMAWPCDKQKEWMTK
jgi:hypothetical protein